MGFVLSQFGQVMRPSSIQSSAAREVGSPWTHKVCGRGGLTWRESQRSSGEAVDPGLDKHLIGDRHTNTIQQSPHNPEAYSDCLSCSLLLWIGNSNRAQGADMFLLHDIHGLIDHTPVSWCWLLAGQSQLLSTGTSPCGLCVGCLGFLTAWRLGSRGEHPEREAG